MMKIEKLSQLIPDPEGLGRDYYILDYEYLHIREKLIYLWGTSECMEELDALLGYSYSPNRPDRQGFPLTVITELHYIQKRHHDRFPFLRSEYSQRLEDPWSVRCRR